MPIHDLPSNVAEVRAGLESIKLFDPICYSPSFRIITKACNYLTISNFSQVLSIYRKISVGLQFTLIELVKSQNAFLLTENNDTSFFKAPEDCYFYNGRFRCRARLDPLTPFHSESIALQLTILVT
jgi:hypothetical protein